MQQVPILTYHANNINGMDYRNNDHIALQQDLRLIHQLGIAIITMDELMARHAGAAAQRSTQPAVVLTCDDGTWFDYYDVEHPSWGNQISFFNILKQHQQTTGQSVHMTNFVIVSPDARIVLDEKCLIGQGWWTDEWWTAAHQSNIMAIENHSWDHNHGVLDNNNVNDDSFKCINDEAACDRQIKQAQHYLMQRLGKQHMGSYFAYPYGNYSAYLRHQYLPLKGPEQGLRAAFTTEPKAVTCESDVWAMPRFVCNNDWHSTEELEQLFK